MAAKDRLSQSLWVGHFGDSSLWTTFYWRKSYLGIAFIKFKKYFCLLSNASTYRKQRGSGCRVEQRKTLVGAQIQASQRRGFESRDSKRSDRPHLDRRNRTTSIRGNDLHFVIIIARHSGRISASDLKVSGSAAMISAVIWNNRFIEATNCKVPNYRRNIAN